jgi:hypothetical protein
MPEDIRLRQSTFRRVTMLDSSPVVAVEAVADLDRGKEFYGERSA